MADTAKQEKKNDATGEEAKDVVHSRYGPYTEKVIEMFKHPKNVGEMKDADAIGKVGSPICGDELWLYLKIEKNPQGELFIKDIKYQSFGCAAAVATGSMITELAKGKTLKDALKITRKDVGAALGGLPTVKLHCTLLSTDALDEAIYQYYTDNKMPIPAELEQLHQNILKGTAIARIKQEQDVNYCAVPEASVKKPEETVHPEKKDE
jgi:nitrogen fixation protein NifU and related proteins